MRFIFSPINNHYFLTKTEKIMKTFEFIILLKNFYSVPLFNWIDSSARPRIISFSLIPITNLSNRKYKKNTSA